MNVFLPYATGHKVSRSEPAIETSDLAVAPAGVSQPILERITLRVPRGCRVALVGANGTGKSTLLKTLAGLLPPLSGRLQIAGAGTARGNPSIAFLAQRPSLEWHFPVTVARAVLAGRYLRLGWLRRPGADDREKALAAMRRLGLEALAECPLHALSGGQQQRVLIARALCQEAAVLLLDEPFAGLDTASRDILESFLSGDARHELTVVMSTHDLAEVEKRFDLILEIRDRRLITLHSCTCGERSRETEEPPRRFA